MAEDGTRAIGKPAIWIVSYPRSGNTYIRALLANYLSQQDRPLTLSELSAVTGGEHLESLWEELTGKAAVDRTLEEQWRARPAYFERMRALGAGNRCLIKSHTVNGSLLEAPAFVFEPCDRIIHLVRHPCDVALSCADFYGISAEEAVSRLLTEDFLIDARPSHGFEVMGSWAQHTLSWRAPLPAPVRCVRYTDLHRDPASILRDLVGFVGAEVDEQRIAAAIDFSGFDRLREEEAADGFGEAPVTAASGRFFREGKPGQWLNGLADDLSQRLTGAYEELLSGLGFASAAAEAPSRRGAGAERADRADRAAVQL